MEWIGELRSMFCPSDDSRYFHLQDRFDTQIIDPTVPATVDKAVSGFMSFHYSQYDQFFKLENVVWDKMDDDEIDVASDQVLKRRTDRIHRVMQTPRNYLALTSRMEDCLVFNRGGYVGDEDESNVMNFNHYPVEALMRWSSDGVSHNIFGVYEDLTSFRFGQRFPEPFFMREDVRRQGIGLGEDFTTYRAYRINIPKRVLYDHILAKYPSADDYDQDFLKYVRHIFKISLKKSSEKMPWVDMWFSEQGIMHVKERIIQNIIIGQFSAGYSPLSWGKGIGEKASSLARILTEVELINLSGYERTYAPPWGVHDAAKELGLDLGRDGITFFDELKGEPRPLSLGADVRGMVEYQQYKQAALAQQFYLDMFEMINKSRMTRPEVEIRKNENFRKAGKFLAADEKYTLQPTVEMVNVALHERLKRSEKNDPQSQYALSSKFTSPLAMAHKQNVFEGEGVLLEYLKIVDGMLRDDGPINDYVDIKEQLARVLKKSGREAMLKTKEEIEEALARRKQMAQAALMERQAAARKELGQASQTLNAAQLAEQGAAGASSPNDSNSVREAQGATRTAVADRLQGGQGHSEAL